MQSRKGKSKKSAVLVELQSCDMSQKSLWPYFHCGELQNSVHHKAYCKGCVSYHLMQAQLLEELEDLDSAATILAENSWFKAGECIFWWLYNNNYWINVSKGQPACTAASSVRGEKPVFIMHILGHGKVLPCNHVSVEATATTTALKFGNIAMPSASGTITKHAWLASTSDQSELHQKSKSKAIFLGTPLRVLIFPLAQLR